MKSRVYLMLSLILILLRTQAASSLPSIAFDGLPPAITPGASFDITVLLTGAEDLSIYNMEVTLSGPGAAGTDFFFSSAAKPSDRYVFTPNDGHFLSALLSPTQKDRATVSDFLDASSVATVAGVNDQVARLSITTSAGFTGPLVLGLATDSLELLDGQLDPIAGASGIIDAPPSARLVVVPEPQTMLAFAGIVLLVRRRRRVQEAG